MGFMDAIKKVTTIAGNIVKPTNYKQNSPLQNPNNLLKIQPNPNQQYKYNPQGYYYDDKDNDGINDMSQPGQLPSQKFRPFNLKNKTDNKNYNGPTEDKHGCYVAKVTYPLPPVKHEEKKFKENTLIKNRDNKYL